MSPKVRRAIGITVRVALVLAIVIFVLVKYDELRNIDVAAVAEKAGNSVFAAVAVIGIYILKAIVFVIPASVFYVAVGMAFRLLPAILVNALGIFAELNVTYFIGRFLGGEAVEKKLKASKYGDKILMLRDKKTPYLFLVRLLPVFPIDFVSLFFGASNMGYGRYLLISFFGIMPRVILFTALGEIAYNIIPYELMIYIAIGAVLAAAIVATVKYIRKTSFSE